MNCLVMIFLFSACLLMGCISPSKSSTLLDARTRPFHENLATKYALEKEKRLKGARTHVNLKEKPVEDLSWIVNFPESFRVFQQHPAQRGISQQVNAPLTTKRTESLQAVTIPGNLIDIRFNSDLITKFEKFTREVMPVVDLYTDGESIDAIEHFFWGMENGVSIELGGLDGSPYTHSQTYELEMRLGWRRVLIEANPKHRNFLRKRSSGAFSVVAPICNTQKIVHYANGLNNDPYTGGIVEYMTPEFLKRWHSDVFNACKYEGNISSLDRSKISSDRLIPLQCMPLSHIIHKIQIKHVNLFILDVEGAELDVLKSINWNSVVFDVLCVETNGDRPDGYNDTISKYLAGFGYKPSFGDKSNKGRNTWFIHQTFAPQKRPGLSNDCFNGIRKSLYSARWMELDGKIDPFVPCKLEEGFDYR